MSKQKNHYHDEHLPVEYKPIRYLVRAMDTARAIAVIEARNPIEAQTRFERIQPIVGRLIVRALPDFVAIEPLDETEQVSHYPQFLDKFFDIIEASDAIKN